MAYFYGSLEGSAQGVVTRTAGKYTGIEAHVRTWDFGARVTIRHDDATDKDIVSVYQSTGSNGTGIEKKIVEFDRDGVFFASCVVVIKAKGKE